MNNWNYIAAKTMNVLSHVYTWHIHEALIKRRNLFYSMWIRNFMGNVGQESHFGYPLFLQGDGIKRIQIGVHCEFGPHCVIGCRETYGEDHFTPTIEIDDYCCFGEYSHISSINKIKIGKGVLTGRFVYIGDNAHGSFGGEELKKRPAERHLVSKGSVVIGKNVWIGDKVSILGGVTIGDNVIIGTGSVVTHSFPDNCLVAGVPARIVKSL